MDSWCNKNVPIIIKRALSEWNQLLSKLWCKNEPGAFHEEGVTFFLLYIDLDSRSMRYIKIDIIILKSRYLSESCDA